jgi:hypothetical protein
MKCSQMLYVRLFFPTFAFEIDMKFFVAFSFPSNLIFNVMFWPLIGALICFLGVFGFGLSTNLYADFLHVSKKTNDFISFITGLLTAGLAIYVS